MKPRPAIRSLAATLLFAAYAQAEQWPLENAKSPVIVNGRTQAASGVVGRGLMLDGNSVIELADSAALNAGTDGFTFSVWFNSYAPNDGHQVIAGKARYSTDERQWLLTVGRSGTLQASVQQSGWYVLISSTPLQPRQWHLATLSVSADMAVLYCDGRRIGHLPLKKPVPATKAPLTLGGMVNAGILADPFFGAVDEARFEPRVLSAEEIRASYKPVTAVHAVPMPVLPVIPLWDERVPLLKAAALPVLPDVEFHVIKKQEPDETDGAAWTLGGGLAWHKGRLYTSYGYNKAEENTDTEEAHVRMSDDGGKTWGPPVVMDHGKGHFGVSHGVFLSQGGKLWAFQGAFYKNIQGGYTRAYLLDEGTGQWQAKGTLEIGGFWPMQEPQKMDDGNWIMAGVNIDGRNHAAVAISHGDDFTKWEKAVIPAARYITMRGESAVLVQGRHITSISRYGDRAIALISTSEDYGRTWSAMRPSNLPMATSKPCAGILSTGQRYLICTTTADTVGKRSPLTIAVSRPGEALFSKVFVIRHSLFPEGPVVSSEIADFSYPYATEHEGRLYVGYTHKSQAANELAIIPLSQLRVEP